MTKFGQSLLCVLFLSLEIVCAKAPISYVGNTYRSAYYIFSINDKVATDIFSSGTLQVTDDDLNNIMSDSVLRKYDANLSFWEIYSKVKEEYPYGNYALLKLNGMGIFLSVYTHYPFRLSVSNDHEKLSLFLCDSLGHSIGDAEVMVGKTKLAYNEATQFYETDTYISGGLVTVRWQGITGYYSLDEKLHVSKKRKSNKFFGTIARLVKDPVVSIREHDAVGYVAKFARIVEKIDDRRYDARDNNINYYDYYDDFYNYETGEYMDLEELEEYDYRKYCKIVYRCAKQDLRHGRGLSYEEKKIYAQYDNASYRNRRKQVGNFLTSQPVYKPNDTVRVKGYLYKRRNRSNSPLSVTISSYSSYPREEEDRKVLCEKLKPFAKGGYVYDFVLSDSLKLLLDKRYKICFWNGKNKLVGTTDFQYEDYELHDSFLDASYDKMAYYKGDSIRVKVRAKDANGMNLQDVLAEVTLHFEKMDSLLSSRSHYYRQLDKQSKTLDGSGETEFVFPPSVAGDNNILFSAEVSVALPDGDVDSKDLGKRPYYNRKHDVTLTLLQDSLLITAQYNGKDTTAIASIYGEDAFGKSVFLLDTLLPCRIKVDPIFASYEVETPYTTDSFPIASSSCQVLARWTVQGDTLFPEVVNARNLPMSCHISVDGQTYYTGSEKSVPEWLKYDEKKTYRLETHFVWAGRVMSVADSVGVPNERQLYIEVQQPSVITPGQKCDMELSVTDHQGKPVKDADVTAWSINSQLNYQSPIWNFPTVYAKDKSRRVSYKLLNFSNAHRYLNLNYDNLPAWQKVDRLDTLEFYNIHFPGTSGYHTYSYYTSDSITQITPLLVRRGQPVCVPIVYIDDKPIYCMMKNVPYSFPITPNEFHQIRLRTSNEEYIIDSVKVEANKRTILSLDGNSKLDTFHCKKMPNTLTVAEWEKLKPYLILFDYDPRDNDDKTPVPYVTHDGGVLPMEKHDYHYYAGPVYGDVRLNGENYSQKVNVSSFREPLNSLIPLKRIPTLEADAPKFRYWYRNAFYFIHDEYLTLERAQQERSDWFGSKASEGSRELTHYFIRSYPKFNGSGNKLQVNTDKSVFRYVLVKYEMDGYPSVVVPISDPEFKDIDNGLYRFYVLHDDSTCYRMDSVRVEPQSLTFIRFDARRDSVMRDSFAKELRSLMYYKSLENEQSESYKGHREKLTRFLHDNDPINVIEKLDDEADLSDNASTKGTKLKRKKGASWTMVGRVSDAQTELPGANVCCLQTSLCVATDVDGRYSIVVHEGDSVSFSFVGYETQYVKVTLQTLTEVNITLTEEDPYDAPLVTVGYGVMKKSDLTGSVVSTSIDQALAGRVAGVQVSPASGQPGGSSTVRIRGLSSLTGSGDPLYVVDGRVCTDFTSIDPSSIMSMELLKDVSATGIYGSRASNGVIIVTTREGGSKTLVPTDVEKGGTLRTNFSDLAFWQPTLRTDKEGKARFSVTFPDDITRWQTIYLAQSDKKSKIRAGSIEGSVKSFVPLSARLYLPESAVEDDSLFVRGRITNYLQDTVGLTSSFAVNDSVVAEMNHDCATVAKDSFLLNVAGDSLSVVYRFASEKGFSDGEKRDVKVLPQGVSCTEGQFHLLFDTLQVSLLSDKADSVTFKLMDSQFDMLQDEVQMLTHYPFGCNEQTTSKLIGFMTALQRKDLSVHQKKQYKEKTQNFVNTLLQRQQESGLWGWYEKDYPSDWISLYVVETLKKYNVEFPTEKTQETCLRRLQSSTSAEGKAFALTMLRRLNAPLAYDSLIKRVEAMKDTTVQTQLSLSYLKALCDIPQEYDWMTNYRKETLLGGVYYLFDKDYSVSRNELLNTLMVYRILQADSTASKEELMHMRSYFYEKKMKSATSHWHNTYESAMLVRTLMDDLNLDEKKSETNVRLSGALQQEVRNFPYEVKLPAEGSVALTKNNESPVFVSVVSTHWDKPIEARGTEFAIRTVLADSVMRVGESVQMKVEVAVQKDADYVLIHVPIPAGCSYASKDPSWKNNEVYREHFKDHTNIFCSSLKQGTYTFTIELMPRFGGIYTLNPAKVEQMYFPEFSATEKMKKVQIR